MYGVEEGQTYAIYAAGCNWARDSRVNTVWGCLTGSKLQEYTLHALYLLVKQNSYHIIVQLLTYSSLNREFNTIQIRGEKPV